MNYADLNKMMSGTALDMGKAADHVAAATDIAIRASRCVQRAGTRVLDEQIAVLAALGNGLQPLAGAANLNDMAQAGSDYARGLGECMLKSSLNVLESQRELGESLYKLAGESSERFTSKAA